ncbi:MAG: PAS-domain containing protein, partial [Kiloniellales bacterium]|nr:PAS-domain containing protein [Kiloniellales bacterium]
MVHSITEEGRLAVGNDVSEDVALAPAVAAALENLGQAVIGSLYRDDLGTAWLVPGIAVEAPYDRYVILGLVDLNQMIDGLYKTQALEGLELRLSASTAAQDPDSATLLFGPNEAAEGTVVTNTIRGVVGGTRFNFLWDVTDGFQGGKGSTRADTVLVGGILVTVLLTLFILFLLRQNEQIARVVRERTAELRLALDNMPGGMFMVDKDLNVRVHNDRFSEIYGLPQGTIRSGGSLRDTVRARAERGDYGPGDVDALVEQRIESYGKGQSERVEEPLPDGRIVEFVRAPTGDGGTVAVVTDITERVKSEETAKRLREAIEGFTDSIILYDKDERVVFSNDRYHELYPNAPPKDEIVGCTQEQLLRRSLEAGLIEDPLAKSDPESWLAQRLEERRQNRFQSGETVHGSGRTLMIRHRPTSEGGLIVAHTDITERKEAEKRLAEKETQLRLAMDYMPGAIFVV